MARVRWAVAPPPLPAFAMPPPAPPTHSHDHDYKVDWGKVAGAVVGGAAFLLVIGGLCFLLRRRRQARSFQERFEEARRVVERWEFSDGDDVIPPPLSPPWAPARPRPRSHHVDHLAGPSPYDYDYRRRAAASSPPLLVPSPPRPAAQLMTWPPRPPQRTAPPPPAHQLQLVESETGRSLQAGPSRARYEYDGQAAASTSPPRPAPRFVTLPPLRRTYTLRTMLDAPPSGANAPSAPPLPRHLSWMDPPSPAAGTTAPSSLLLPRPVPSARLGPRPTTPTTRRIAAPPSPPQQQLGPHPPTTRVAAPPPSPPPQQLGPHPPTTRVAAPPPSPPRLDPRGSASVVVGPLPPARSSKVMEHMEYMYGGSLSPLASPPSSPEPEPTPPPNQRSCLDEIGEFIFVTADFE